MEKVLMVLDGQHFPHAAFDFACRMNEQCPILLTGVFLPSTDYSEVMVYYMSGMNAPAYYPNLDTEQGILQGNMERFAAQCQKEGIEYRVHNGFEGDIMLLLQKESRYSDLVLLSSSQYYSHLGPKTQEQMLHKTAHVAECPVLLLPEGYEYPQKLILTYDGSAASVYAIKQFAYLFPELAAMEAILVYADDADGILPDYDYIIELAARHYPALSMLKLEADPEEYFNAWLSDKGPVVVVSGAFGRSGFSGLFKESFVSQVIRKNQLPVFVAHK